MKQRIMAILLAMAMACSLMACGKSGSARGGALASEASANELKTMAPGTNETEFSGAAMDEGLVFEYLETDKGKEFLTDYFFGEEKSEALNLPPEEEAKAEVEENKGGVTNLPDNSSNDASEVAGKTDAEKISEAQTIWDAMSDDDKVAHAKEYMAKDHFWLNDDIKKYIKECYPAHTELLDKAPNADKPVVEEELFAKLEDQYKNVKTKEANQFWLTICNDFTTETQNELWLYIYNQQNNNETEPQQGSTDDSQPENTDVLENNTGVPTEPKSEVNISGKGHDWLIEQVSAQVKKQMSAQVQEQKDDRKELWDVIDDETKKLMVTSYVDQNPNEKFALLKISAFEYVFIGFTVVIFAAFVAVCVLLYRSMRQTEGLRSKLKEVDEPKSNVTPVASRSAGAMAPELKEKLTNSPVRSVEKADPPKNPKLPIFDGIVPDFKMEENKPVEQKKESFTPPVVSPVTVAPAKPKETVRKPAPVVPMGHYKVSDESAENARIHLEDENFHLEKVTGNYDPATAPFIYYSDGSLDYNMDHYAKLGGNRPGMGKRAWTSLMGASVQIGRCFDVISISNGSVNQPSEAADRKIRKIEKAKMSQDGRIITRGTIILE